MFRWINAVIGWIICKDFTGAILGYLIGWGIDSLFTRTTVTSHKINTDTFTSSLLVFTAAVMKADGHLYKTELYYVKNYLLQNMGHDDAVNALEKLKELLDDGYDLNRTCQTVYRQANDSEKLLMLRFLFGLANSDGEITDSELRVIKYISDSIGIPSIHYESLKAMYVGSYSSGYERQQQSYSSSSRNSYGNSSYNSLDNDYKILGISSSATDDEVKKAYRKLAKEHHPDRVAHLGEDMRKAAEEKFTKLNQAYERIKAARGMK